MGLAREVSAWRYCVYQLIRREVMSIERFKREAKQLKKEWPGFVARYGDDLPLAGCQELLAKCKGYDNWQSAVDAAKLIVAEQRGAHPVLTRSVGFSGLTVVCEMAPVVDHTESGREKPETEINCLTFVEAMPGLFDRVTDQLEGYLERHTDGLGGDFEDDDAAQGALTLARELVRDQPAYLDAYACIAGTLVRAGRPSDAITEVADAYSAAVALIPAKFKGRIPYWSLENRPFFRLGYNLMCAYYALGTREADAKGKAIAQSMYAWWPNDNLGFRFALTGRAFRKQ